MRWRPSLRDATPFCGNRGGYRPTSRRKSTIYFHRTCSPRRRPNLPPPRRPVASACALARREASMNTAPQHARHSALSHAAGPNRSGTAATWFIEFMMEESRMTQSSANVVLMAAPAKPSGGDLPPADTARRASPFRDGYDIEGAREHLEDLQENPDPTDPRWPQLVELEEREDMLRRMQARAKEGEGAEPVVPDKEARAIREVGKLVSEETDTMTLHTKDAYRLFIGKVKTDKKVYPFVCGKRAASPLRSA